MQQPKYKIQPLVEKGFDFRTIFPDKQNIVKEMSGYDFSIPEIVKFIQVQTNNFQEDNLVAFDLDDTIYKLYVKSTGGEKPAEAPATAPASSSKEELQARLRTLKKMAEKKPKDDELKSRIRTMEKRISKMADGGAVAYAGGGLFGDSRYNTGRSWTLDHNQHNKKEAYEVPMKKRAKKYFLGGGVGDTPVSEDRYEEMRGAVPPIYITSIDGHGVTNGFAVGEAYTHDATPDGFKALYTAFYTFGDKYYEVADLVYFTGKGLAKTMQLASKYAEGGDVKIGDEPPIIRQVFEDTEELDYAKGGGVGDIELLKNKIRSRSKKMEIDGESGYGGYVVYLDGNKVDISNYTDLTPYSAQATDNEIKVSFNAPNKSMIIFSDKVDKRFEDNKSFEKYGGIKYIYEPLTNKSASEIYNKLLSEKYAEGGGVGKKQTIMFEYKGKKHKFSFTPDEPDEWTAFESHGMTFDVHYDADYGHIVVYLDGNYDKTIYKKDIPRTDLHEYKRGGNISDRTNYLSKRDIDHIETKSGKVIKGSQVVDGAYVKKKVKFEAGGRAGKANRNKEDYEVYKFLFYEIDNKEETQEILTPDEAKEKIKEWNKSYGTKYKDWEAFNSKEDYYVFQAIMIKKAKMAEGGGMATFDDKVKAISERLEGSEVSPKYRKKYGKKYNKAEAQEAAKNIAGAMRKKENQ